MTPFLQLALEISVIILAAKLAGYLSTRLGQPSVFGELVIGLLLGPSLLNLTHLPFVTDPHLEETIRVLGEIGVLMLMFLAGMELHLRDLVRNSNVAAFAGALGVAVPVGLGALIGLAFGMVPDHALFLGLTLGATSVSISAQTLMELNVLRSRVGLALLGAAVFDDIFVILLLSAATAILEGSGGGVWQIALIAVRMALFLVLALLAGYWGIPRLVRVTAKLPISQGVLTLTLAVMLLFGVAAEVLGGMAAITGAFLAGLLFGRTSEKPRLEAGMHAIAYGLFVPIFFVDIGLQVNVRGMGTAALLLLLVTSLVGILGKILGAGGGARLGGFNWQESLQIGIGMVSRGEVGLIVASVGLSGGFLSEEVFSTIVGVVLISTLVTPPLLRFSFAHTLPGVSRAAALKVDEE